MKRIINIFGGHTELMVGTFSFIGYVMFWLICVIFNIAPPPLAFIIKPIFGLFCATIIMTAVWLIFQYGYRAYKKMIDPDDINEEKELSKWEKTKLAFWFFALYVGIAAYSASQL